MRRSLVTILAGPTAGVLLLASCSSSTSTPPGKHSIGYPNGDSANTRQATTSIDSSNVSNLGRDWVVQATPANEVGAFVSSPVIADGVVYVQDLDSGVQAIDLETGNVEWRQKFHSPTTGPNGIFVGTDGVYGATTDEAFRLDRETGEEIWSTRLIRDPSE